MSRRFEATHLPGVVQITPQVHEDFRGTFLETHHEPAYRNAGIDARFVQDNQSRSVRGTLRGLHAQSPHPQAKLVRVVEGEIFDVAVDIRRGSPCYGQYVSALLSGENHRQLYLPPLHSKNSMITNKKAEIARKISAIL